MVKNILLLFSVFMIVGCGSENLSSSDKPILIDKTTKAYFGALSNASVKIYELNGAKKLILDETTTTGDTLSSIGNFKINSATFSNEKFYQYEVIGGENWDVDKNAKKDNTPTPNSTIYRAIYKGKKPHVGWWKTETSGVRKVSE